MSNRGHQHGLGVSPVTQAFRSYAITVFHRIGVILRHWREALLILWKPMQPAYYEALTDLWEAELAYDAGVDGATRKVAWEARNRALDRLHDLVHMGNSNQ